MAARNDEQAKTRTGWAVFLISLLVLLGAVAVGTSSYGWMKPRRCRSIPGDDSWPGESDWKALNQTVNGKLIATVPIAAVCHSTVLEKSGDESLYDEEACAALRDNWFFPATHLSSPSSPMAYEFTNNSCNPFLDPESPCTLGNQVAYTINVTTVADIQAAVQFSGRHNVRVVIRNTGHDYLGKSTGAHALAIVSFSSLDLGHVYDCASS